MNIKQILKNKTQTFYIKCNYTLTTGTKQGRNVQIKVQIICIHIYVYTERKGYTVN